MIYNQLILLLGTDTFVQRLQTDLAIWMFLIIIFVYLIYFFFN